MRFLTFLALFVFFVSGFELDAQTIFHYGNYDQLVEKAADEKKHYFIDFYTDWCKPCKKMDKEAFRDPEISAFINKNFLAYKINPEKSTEADQLGNKFGIKGYPTLIFFDENGKEIGRVTYYLDKNSFFKKIKAFKKDIPNTEYSDFR